MERILIITWNYPYYPGEQFLETEIRFWGNNKEVLVTLLPSNTRGKPRKIPRNIKLIKIFDRRFDLLFSILQVFFSKFLYIEIKSLIQEKKININNLINLFYSVLKTEFFRNKLENWIHKNGVIDTVYTYWSSEQTYAACILKSKGLTKSVITRTHGYDIYEERRKNNYMPLKRQFLPLIDKIYVLSDQARLYLKCRYQIQENKVDIQRLGVHVSREISDSTKANEFHLVSVSSITHVKRIDRIIDSLELFIIKNKKINCVWNHIGSGILEEKIKEYSFSKLKYYKNLEVNFLGEISNDEVREFYTSNKVDLFVNVSEAEGTPVSIMEAMSMGIPAMGPNIGGISELITNQSGYLLPKDPTVQEIHEGLERMLFLSKQKNIRFNAKKLIEEKFSAEKNYKNFIQEIISKNLIL